MLLERGSIYSLQGLTREPSHLASAMFWLGLIIIFSNYSKRFIWKMLLCVSLFMLISRSFSGILFILALYTIYAIENNKKKFIYSLLLIIVAPVILLSSSFSYYVDRIGNVLALLKLGGASTTISEHVRVISIIENLKIFLSRPFFGIGIGTTYAHGALPSILSNIGILGFLTWFVFFIFKGIGKMKFNVTNALIVTVLIIVSFITQSISLTYSVSMLLLMLQIRYKIQIKAKGYKHKKKELT